MSTCECDFLERRYPIERNSRVVFNDDINPISGIQNHDYYIDGKKIDSSVTAVIHNNFPHFDPESISAKIINGKRWSNDPDYKYYKVSKEDILKQWSDAGKEASELGSLMHMDIEMFYNYVCFLTELYRFINMNYTMREHFERESKSCRWKEFIISYYREALSKKFSIQDMRRMLTCEYPDYCEIKAFKEYTESIESYPQRILSPFTNDSKEFKQFISFFNDTRNIIFPYRTELIMFDDDHQLAGSIDMLFKDIEGQVYIYDWKRSKEFKYENRWQKGSGLLLHLDDCNIVHYSLQMNMYRRILQTHYGETVAGMVLIRCHPNIESYDKYESAIMDEEISAILAKRLEYLNDNILTVCQTNDKQKGYKRKPDKAIEYALS